MNQTPSSTVLDSSGARELEQAIFGTTVVGVGIVGVLGNLTVLAVLGSNKKLRRQSMHFVLLLLAVADLLNLVANAPDILTVLLGADWALGLAACRALRYAAVAALYCSLLFQNVVCIERYIAVIYPLKSRQLVSRGCVSRGCILCVVLALLCALPYAVFQEMYMDRCYATVPDNWKMIEFVWLFACPSVLMLTMYGRICWHLWRLSDSAGRLLFATAAHLSQNYSFKLRQRRAVTKLLVTCVLLYLICYAPIEVSFVLTYAGVSVSVSMALLFNTLAYASAAVNPLVYGIFLLRYRHALTGNANTQLYARSSLRNATPGCDTDLRGVQYRSPSTSVIPQGLSREPLLTNACYTATAMNVM